MATEIRVIPTLHGEEARKFIENAEWTEAHPGRIKVNKEDVEFLLNYLHERDL